ncbi:MAG: LEPR-XLL domain-containing protein, partial [Phycisphaerales bacterium]
MAENASNGWLAKSWRFTKSKRASDADDLGSSQPRLEILEPRVLLSADGLLSSLVVPTPQANPPSAQTQPAYVVGIDDEVSSSVDVSPMAALTAIVPQTIPYASNFLAGLPTAEQGWEYYSPDEGVITTWENSLWMYDSMPGDPYSLNEAILHVNLTGKSGIQLSCQHTSIIDTDHPLPASFTGHADGDGIALSVDGIHWITVISLAESFPSRFFNLDALLDQAKVAAGANDVSDVRIKFQQYDNYPDPDDGRRIGNITIVTGALPQTLPYIQDFSGGIPSAAQGWEYYSSTQQGRIQVVGGRLRLDDFGGGDPYTLNEAILHVDLAGRNNIQLSCDHFSLADDDNPLPASFTGHYNGDGIALSVDGIHWVTVSQLTTDFAVGVFSLDSLMDQAKAAAGTADVSDVRIKFQQYDNYPVPDDGREFDNIRLSTGITPQTLPYSQDFSGSLPTAAQGWEYHGSTSQSRIQIVGGRLRMDDSGPGDPWSQNEAILHLDLTGKNSVRLTVDHYNLADENDPLPASFTGQRNGDGIALSTDGIHWITVTQLTSSFTAGIFSLDAVLDQAKTAAGNNNVSDVRIKFQQYDNYPVPDDGREFDNIQIAVGSTPQTLPCTQDFSAGLPAGGQGWEYYSSEQGRIRVVGGRLRLDDSVAGDPYSLNEAILHVNLTGRTSVQLSLDHTNLGDESHALAAGFTDHANGDGIALSVDGVHWVTVAQLTSSFTAGIFNLDAFLAQAKLAAGSNNVSDVRIKLQQHDNDPAPGDGREFGNVHVISQAIPQAAPYAQDFTAGLPTAAQGWEYRSDNQGRIQVVNGRLRMDDTTADDAYSYNEAILHVNLAGTTYVQLTLDHYNLSDENDAHSADSYSSGDTVHADQIDLSVDGLHWVRVAALAGSFTGRTFNLNTLLDQAKALAGSSNVSDVRIKFSQYDNDPASSDGREFDNIQVIGVAAQTIPYAQDFAAGLPGAAQGWGYYSSNDGRIQVTGGRLRMDDSGADDPYSLNEAILHVNLTGKSSIQLTLDHVALADESTSLPAEFTGHYNGDGIALSVDGVHWVTIASLAGSFTDQAFALDAVLLAAKNAAGSTDVSNVRIKFQQYDNDPAPDDGREFDNIRITAGVISQTTPYAQDFSAGRPDATQGWEYYSDNQGRIQVTGGRLRMEDSGGGDPWSLNEAILHMDFTGKSQIQLSLDHISISDENDPLPASFTGHYNGDGIALSVDGIHWITVARLTSSLTSQVFPLDAALAEAKTAAGSTVVSDVRIKIQQYDNYPAPDDGREFDNIQVTAGITPQSAPYFQDFSGGMPGATQGWEYWSNNQGRTQIVDGRLRMDDWDPGNAESVNEAILHMDFTGKSDIQLTLDHYSLSEEKQCLRPTMYGHYPGDGIALSVDGRNWVMIVSQPDSFLNRTFALDALLETAKQLAGTTDVSDVRIKFQQCDDFPAPDDGREYDNIRVTAGITPQATPYAQDFSGGLPGATQGWEYYSDNDGRIQVTGGRMRMDDSGPGDPWSLNEAVLHVDFTGKSNIQLTCDHVSIGDENEALPTGFTGHYNGDGIALSVDGIHWIRVTSLTGSFTAQAFTLDTLL